MKTIKLIFLTSVVYSLFTGICSSQWVDMSNGIESKYIRCVASGTNAIYAGSAWKGLYYSANSGVSWIQTSLNNTTVFSLAVNKNKIFAGAETGFYLSTDDGTSWTLIVSNVITFLSSEGDNIIAGGGSSAIHISTNNGETWNHNYFDNQEVTSLYVYNNIFFTGTERGLYLSTDYGSSWDLTTFTKPVSSIAVKGDYIFTGNSTYGLYLSTDKGNTWDLTLLNNRWIYSILTNGNTVFAGNFPVGFSTSNDNGISWHTNNEGLDGLIAKKLCVYDNYIFAGTDRGLYRRPLRELISN
jgi:hypothetical protein